MLNRLRSIEDNFSVSKAALIVGFFTLLSRVAGLIREALFASVLGPGDKLDVYYASFRIPDFIFNLLVLGTLSVAFIPVFTQLLVKEKPRAFEVANTILNFSVVVITVLCGLLILFARPLSRLIVPGFEGVKFEETVLLTRLFLVSPVIFTASNVVSSMLHSHRKFLVVSLAPILYNVGIIFGLVVLYPRFGFIGWGVGVLAGALMHLLIQVPLAARLGYVWRPVMRLKDGAVRQISRLFLPRVFGMDISNISLLIATIIGSTLASGTISIFNLANNLQAVPLGIFALSVAVAVFPALSDSYARRDGEHFIAAVQKSISQILFFIIPVSILILLFRAHLVRLAYGHGQYSWEDTTLTFTALGIFSVSLFAQSLAPLFSRAFYAQHDTKTPVIINAVSMLVNAVLAYALGKHGGQYGGVAGLAIAFSVASIVNTLILFTILRLRLARLAIDSKPHLLSAFDSGLFKNISGICVASVGMGFTGFLALRLFEPLVNNQTTFGLLIQSGLACTSAVIVFLYMASALRISEASDITAFLGRCMRIFRRDPGAR